jgi:hypothetical protein
VLRDLATGEARRFKPKDVRGAKRIDAERFEARLVQLASGEVVALHPDSAEQRPLLPQPKTAGDRLVVVWTSDGAFQSGLPVDASKD